MSKTTELEQLQDALEHHEKVCRIRTDSGTVSIDVYWLEGFQPEKLLKELRGNGFRFKGVVSKVMVDLGIPNVKLESKRADALDVARKIAAACDMTKGEIDWDDKLQAP